VNENIKNKYECVIGLEIHAELKTKTKIFCRCKTSFGARANTSICPVCMGFPGTLPVLNKKAVEYATKAAVALNCTVNKSSRFDRKNYFYPDLPKGYQITQFFHPIAQNGFLTVEIENEKKRIGITRIHMEEDAGKLIHENGVTKADFNRSGLPLIEIVTEPDMRSPEEAVQFLKKLRLILLYTGVSDCKMNEGSMRCDVNLSVRKKSEASFGQKVEIKNINSFQFAHKAMEYEFERQTTILENSGKVDQETRRFDEKTGTTISMRKKEDAADYKFFPEPDLGELCISDEYISELRGQVPMLPDERKKLYTKTYCLTQDDAETLISEPEFAYIFDKAVEMCQSPKTLSNLILSEGFKLRKEKNTLPSMPENLALISNLISSGKIGSTNAKKVLSAIWDSTENAEDYAKNNNLLQINDKAILLPIVKNAIENSSKSVSDYKSGKQAAFKAIVGKIMAETKGCANAEIVTQLLIELLG